MSTERPLLSCVPTDAVTPPTIAPGVLDRLTHRIRTWHHDLANCLAGGISLSELMALRSANPELARLASRLSEQLEAIQHRSAAMTDGLPRRHEREVQDWAALAEGLVASPRADRVQWPAGALPRMPCPPQALRQILRQLVHNALDAQPSRVEVTAGMDGPPPHVRITVVDDGTGCDLATLRAFAEPTDGEPRLGLGLVTAASIAAQHGGVVWLQERSGGGTTAAILLPTRA